MSLYDNDKNNVFPDLNLTGLQEPQTYHLEKVIKVEAYLLDKIEVRKRIAKRKKQFNTITNMVNTGLTTPTVIILLEEFPLLLLGLH